MKQFSSTTAQVTMEPSVPLLWMGMALGVAFGLVAAVLALKGPDSKSLRLALWLTARWSFLLFWIAYSGRAMAELFGSSFAPLASRGREFGLAYASAQLMHVGLVVWLSLLLSHLPLSGKLTVFFIVGIFWTYLLAALSFGRPAESLGPTAWRTLRIAGLNYILFAFASDFVPPMVHLDTEQYKVWHLVGYGPFAVMSLAAPVLVLAAAAHRHLGTRAGHLRPEAVVNSVRLT